MKRKVISPLILTLVSVIVCALLVIANALTKDKIIAAQKQKSMQTLSETFGEADYKQLDMEISGIDAVYQGGEKTIFELTADGYAKSGLHILVGFENDKVCGIGFLDVGETPGLGTKVRDNKSFAEQFLSASDDTYDFEVITGATYSSKGMKNAVDTAINVYNEYIKGGKNEQY